MLCFKKRSVKCVQGQPLKRGCMERKTGAAIIHISLNCWPQASIDLLASVASLFRGYSRYNPKLINISKVYKYFLGFF